MQTTLGRYKEIRHFHLFCGLGGGARGFNKATARVGSVKARFRCIGGIDNDVGAIKDFESLAGVPGTVMDLFSRDQYIRYHGEDPPSDWREATTNDIHRAAGGERPHIVFLSAPCQGFSGLLSKAKSKTEKYRALNELTLRGIWLMLEAFKDDPVEMVLFENVPRIVNRGRYLLDQISELLHSYGYAVAETTHDCGELGGLAQSRKRFLLVARHEVKVPPFLYEPVKKSLRSVGDILERMPLPGDEAGGPMHRVPNLQWKTWVRLAFVEAGGDWRSLKRLAVENGQLRDYLIVPHDVHEGSFTAANEAFSVADPRFNPSATWVDGQAYGVRRWNDTAGTVTGQRSPGQGNFSVADPRINLVQHDKLFRVESLAGLSQMAPGVAYQESGHLMVNDQRMPKATDKLVSVIRSSDGTWNRPFTTLELAALQSLVDPDEDLYLYGSNDGHHRERIGNAVPPDAAQAIASVIGETLLLAWTGETFVLGSTPIWVRPVATALSVAGGYA